LEHGHLVTALVSPAPQVIKVVAPKRAALAAAEEALEVVMVGLRAKQAELQVRPRLHRRSHPGTCDKYRMPLTRHGSAVVSAARHEHALTSTRPAKLRTVARAAGRS
jgi:predicted metal-dependent hydrolase